MIGNGKPLVSIIIPTRNSEKIIGDLLRSISQQTYKELEVIVVDNHSTDNTKRIAKRSGANVLVGGPKPPLNNYFTAPVMRQLGLLMAKGQYVYFVDSDMTLAQDLISECIEICESGITAVIVPEISIGIGFWASCKIAERNCYPGNMKIEAPRFFHTSSLKLVGGWQYQAGGMDDWFTHFAMRRQGFKIGYSRNYVFHNEGTLSLARLFRKKFNIGKSTNISGYFDEVHSDNALFEQLTPLRFVTLAYLMTKQRNGLKKVLGALLMKNIEAMAFYFGSLLHKATQEDVYEMLPLLSEYA